MTRNLPWWCGGGGIVSEIEVGSHPPWTYVLIMWCLIDSVPR